MESKFALIIAGLIFWGVYISCNGSKKIDEASEVKVIEDNIKEDINNIKNIEDDFLPPLNDVQNIEDSLEIFLKNYFIPGIENTYRDASLGHGYDQFIKLKNELGNNFAFLSVNALSGWHELLKRIKTLLEETKSKYNIVYWMITPLNYNQFPSVTIYEVIKRENKKPPVKEMSDFWGLDFNNLFPSDTTFLIEYAFEPLLYTYEIWLQKKRQKSILEGMSFKDSNLVILFTTGSNPLKEQQSLIHEFGHIFFDMKTKYLSDFELENYRLFVEQSFTGGAKTTVSFSYREFGELMAKLSELIVVPDDSLFAYIKEVSRNKMPGYQMTRQLISSTTVYKYLADEHPQEFLKLQRREITNNEIEMNLYRMSLEKTETGKNKLRSYLDFHVVEVSRNLENIVFK